MTYLPADLVPVKVELQINGEWKVVTSRARGGRAASGVGIKHGRSDGAARAETTRCTLRIGNADGYLTEGNPVSPWYPYIRRGCPIRVSLVDVLPGDTYRFTGQIDTMQAVYPGGGVDSSLDITAFGMMGALVENSVPLRSPLFRTIGGMASDGTEPLVYYPAEEAASATEFASGVVGGPAVAIPPGVTLSASSTLAGSDRLPTWADGRTVNWPIPGYVDTGQWIARWTINVPSAPSVTKYLAHFNITGSVIRWSLTLEPGSPDVLALRGFDSSNAEVAAAVVAVDSGGLAVEDDFYGHDFMIAAAAYQSGGNIVGMLTATREDGLQLDADSGTVAGTAGVLTGDSVLVSAIDGQAMGHFHVITDPAFDITAYMAAAGADSSSTAMSGHAGELPHVRVERLCREEQIAVTVIGTSDIALGAQSTSPLLTLLTEVEEAEGGILSDDLSSMALVYRCLPTLYNQAAAVEVLNGSLTPDFAPIWDNQQTRNDVTMSRPGGSSGHAVDEAHIAATGRRVRYSGTANVHLDTQLPARAQWEVHLGTTSDPRYPVTTIDMRNGFGATLANSILGAGLGDRLTVAAVALPSQHPPGGLDQIVTGWQERLDGMIWRWSPVLNPASPYTVAVEGDDVLGKADTDGSVLTADVSDSATTMLVGTTTGTSPLWTTDGGEMPLPLLVGGEVVSATAVAAPTTITFGAAGTVTHASNASVTPGIPASVAAGNLLLVLAAIRNSGTGVPDTPSGYTRLPVFPVSSNVQLFGKVAVGGDAAPTITFTGGVANATTSAQMCRIAGAYSAPDEALVVSNTQLNASAQDIAYPALAVKIPNLVTDNCIVLYLGWKPDDWTSVASPGTEIGEPDTTTGDDQGIVWAYTIQTSAADIAAASFVVTGGASAISRAAVCAIRSNVQSMTVTRSVNGVTKAQTARTDVRLTPGAVAAY